MTAFRTLDGVNLADRRVLIRVDLNVPMQDGKVSDLTRIAAIVPTVLEVADKGGKAILLAHFGRPKGGPDPSLSLAPVRAALAAALDRPVDFAEDCIGPVAEAAVAEMAPGDVLLLENTRFHKGEEKNDPAFTEALARLGDIYVNEAFSAAHRAHSTTEGLAHHLPAYAGRTMQKELEALEKALSNPKRPVVAVVGGAKVSSKIDLLKNLVAKVDALVIGGGMANTFLLAEGRNVGRSLAEPDLAETAREIQRAADAAGCRIVLPIDVVAAEAFAANAPSKTVGLDAVPAASMILDVGPASVAAVNKEFDGAATLVWNGPLGAFEIAPFDKATVAA
ncbi:MAG: phosphoglycerate kinase, partial [Bauldia sp.]|nr:phosphoglycerate kinase [Bauldia sp.]